MIRGSVCIGGSLSDVVRMWCTGGWSRQSNCRLFFLRLLVGYWLGKRVDDGGRPFLNEFAGSSSRSGSGGYGWGICCDRNCAASIFRFIARLERWRRENRQSRAGHRWVDMGSRLETNAFNSFLKTKQKKQKQKKTSQSLFLDWPHRKSRRSPYWLFPSFPIFSSELTQRLDKSKDRRESSSQTDDNYRKSSPNQ